MSEVSEDIAQQSRNILQTFVWWGAQACPLSSSVDGYLITGPNQKLRKTMERSIKPFFIII